MLTSLAMSLRVIEGFEAKKSLATASPNKVEDTWVQYCHRGCPWWMVTKSVKTSFAYRTRRLFQTTLKNWGRKICGQICTMLQKLSKCEVKVHNTRIHLPFNFASNQFWQILNLKNWPFYNFRDTQLWILVNLGLEKWLKITKIKIQNWDSLKL